MSPPSRHLPHRPRTLPIPTARRAESSRTVLGALARTASSLPVVLGGGLLIGVGLPWPLISALTTLQTTTPNELLGRTAATANTMIFAPTGLALLAGTAMVAVLDRRVQLLAAGVLAPTTALLLALSGRTRAEPPEGPGTDHRLREAGTPEKG